MPTNAVVIADLTLRWVVTLLFLFSAAECAYAIAAGARTPLSVVGQTLHLIMAVAMAVMAWPKGAALPTVAPMIFFLLATAWFVAAAVIEPHHWLGNMYHSAMMLAMAWMYAAMNGRILPGQAAAAGGSGGHHGMSMPGMDMSGTEMPDTGASGTLPYITAVNWFWTVGFAVAALWWSYRFVTRSNGDRWGPLAQAMMAAGMAVMFAVML